MCRNAKKSVNIVLFEQKYSPEFVILSSCQMQFTLKQRERERERKTEREGENEREQERAVVW